MKAQIKSVQVAATAQEAHRSNLLDVSAHGIQRVRSFKLPSVAAWECGGELAKDIQIQTS